MALDASVQIAVEQYPGHTPSTNSETPLEKQVLAQKYIVQLVDDLTNEPIEEGAGESVHFSLDGVSYAIDLSAEHADEFRSTLTQYVNAARKSDAVAVSKSRSSRSSSASRTDLKDVRDWAAKNGYKVSSRGRIPGSVQDAYAAAH